MNHNEFKLIVNEANIPSIIEGEFKTLNELKRKVDNVVRMADKAKQSVDDAYSKSAGFGKKKVAIESLQNAAVDLAEAQISMSEAQQVAFQYQEKLSEITQYLFALGVTNMAANRSVIRELQLRLENASEEELGELAKQEIANVIRQLKAQEDIMLKQENLDKKIKKHEERLIACESKEKSYLQKIDGQAEVTQKHDTDIKELKNQEQKFEERIDKHSGTLNNHDGQLNDHKNKIITQGKKIENIDKQLNEQNTTNSTFEQKINNQAQDVKNHGNQLEAHSNRLDDYAQKVKKHDELIQELTDENIRLKEIIKNYESEFQAITNNVNRLLNSKWRMLKKR